MTGDEIDPKTMVYADDSDLVVAKRVRMLYRDQLDHEAVCTGARDRIMYLSQELARQTTEVKNQTLLAADLRIKERKLIAEVTELGTKLAQEREMKNALVRLRDELSDVLYGICRVCGEKPCNGRHESTDSGNPEPIEWSDATAEASGRVEGVPATVDSSPELKCCGSTTGVHWVGCVLDDASRIHRDEKGPATDA